MAYEEMFGLPASGKSTIAIELSNQVIKVDNESKITKVKGIFKILIFKPKLIFLSIYGLKFIGPKCSYVYWKGVFRLFFRYLECLKYSSNKSMFLLEEGIFQALWGVSFVLVYNDKSNEFISRLSEAVLSDLKVCKVIIVNVEKKPWFTMYHNRNKPTRLDSVLDDDALVENVFRWLSFVEGLICKFGIEKKIIVNSYENINCR
ncbi:TPA: hypothetical protein L3N28_003281 [Vibrio parahaemolyticus]|nr:hypothetical protein [Vibrio parahaemolyticus]HBN6312887.1 hypothetical protein [Vibrio parahaemolyticus]